MDIVQKFISRLGQQDVLGAREYVAPHRQKALDLLVQTPSALSQSAADALAMTNLRVLRRTIRSVWIMGDVPGAAGSTELEFILNRDTETGVWKLVNY
jgi:hypothetical protein